ncbi:MAG TPA: efflux RND transporter periplasmic adaptor subunit [candidate division Zixibacteria bacterium]|jgi:HlyD family secretion protein
MKRIIWGVIIVALVAGGYWWYSNRGDDAATALSFVREAVAERGDLVVSITATGRIDPVEQVEVKSKASGEIIELPIQEGSFVHKGDLIARLNRVTAENDYEQAKADLAVAEATVRQRQRERDRAQSLMEQGLASANELDQVVLTYEQANSQFVRARAALSTAQERLEDTEVRAPIDGIVLTRPVEIGQVISSGTTTVTGGTLLCTVARMDKVYVVADVDETDIGRVEPGLVAKISPDAFSDLSLEGIVQRIAPLAKVEQNVTVFEVTALVKNEDFLLKAGMNATCEIVIAESRNTIMIPARAVQMRPRETRPENRDTTNVPRQFSASDAIAGEGPPRRGGRMGPAVEVRSNGLTQWRPVTTGLSNYEDIEIVEGVAEGDTVLYNLSSGALQQRADFRDRMRERSSVPGMQRSR